jgi:transposase InsO family protein
MACKTLGYSRDSYYRFKDLYESRGEEGLIEISRRKPILANRVESHVEKAVIDIAVEYPAYGQERVANELKKQGIMVSAGGVRSIWIRNDLNNFKKRLQALEAKVAQEGIILTESQLQALEKKKAMQEANGEINTEHPGYLCAQDTYYVGTIKGVGKVYQQTFIDTYSKRGEAKLYDEKTAITAADILNDRVLPWYEEQQVPILRILTDRGTEFCGKVESNAYELFLHIENLDHTKTKAYSPQTNGICKRFYKTIEEEFYDIAFRKLL